MSLRNELKRNRSKGNHITRLEQLGVVIEEMKQEFAIQRQALEHKINCLERELKQASQTQANRVSNPEDRPTSRRRMLKRLGVTAAGFAAASVAASLVQEAPIAEAATNMQLASSIGDPGGVNQGGGTTTITTPASGNTFNTLLVQNQFTAAGPNGSFFDALVATSNQGVAINAQSAGANAAVLGVLGANDLISVDAQANGASTVAGVTGSTNTGNGVAGFSQTGIGVYGFSSKNYGAVFSVGRVSGQTQITGAAPLLIVPEPQAGPPVSSNGQTVHNRGEIHIDNNGDMWVCIGVGTSSGQPTSLSPNQLQRRFPGISASDIQHLLVGVAPTWAKVITTQNSGGTTLTFLNSPLRVVGPYNSVNTQFVDPNAFPGNIVYLKMEGTWTDNNPPPYGVVTDTIPSSAIAIVGSISAVFPKATGYATIFPANVSTPVSANLGYIAGTIAVNTFVSKLGAIPNGPNAGTKGIGVFSSTTCAIAIDVFAYYS